MTSGLLTLTEWLPILKHVGCTNPPEESPHEEHADAGISNGFLRQQRIPQLAVGPVCHHQEVAFGGGTVSERKLHRLPCMGLHISRCTHN